MSRLAFLVRFFRAVSPVQPLMVGAFAAVVVIAGFVVTVDVDRAAAALAPILLLQTFAVSSGFAGPARRGHYDLPLTTGRGRRQIALVHWATSASPGIATWLTVAAIEIVVRQEIPAVSLSSGTIAAMFLVSTVPWAVTVPLPRLTGGMCWGLLLVMTTTALPAAQREALLAGTGGTALLAGVAVLTCPWIVVGRDLVAADAFPVAMAMLMASAAMAAAIVWIDRADVPLEAAQ